LLKIIYLVLPIGLEDNLASIIEVTLKDALKVIDNTKSQLNQRRI